MNEKRAQELLNTLVNDMVEKSGRQIYSVVQTLECRQYTPSKSGRG